MSRGWGTNGSPGPPAGGFVSAKGSILALGQRRRTGPVTRGPKRGPNALAADPPAPIGAIRLFYGKITARPAFWRVFSGVFSLVFPGKNGGFESLPADPAQSGPGPLAGRRKIRREFPSSSWPATATASSSDRAPGATKSWAKMRLRMPRNMEHLGRMNSSL